MMYLKEKHNKYRSKSSPLRRANGALHWVMLLVNTRFCNAPFVLIPSAGGRFDGGVLHGFLEIGDARQTPSVNNKLRTSWKRDGRFVFFGHSAVVRQGPSFQNRENNMHHNRIFTRTTAPPLH